MQLSLMFDLTLLRTNRDCQIVTKLKETNQLNHFNHAFNVSS